MTAVDLIRRLHQHRAWVNGNLLAAATELTDEQLRKPFPIGQGSIQPRFFGMLRASGFQGPLTMQFEYAWEGGDGLESRLKSLKQDNLQLREWVKA